MLKSTLTTIAITILVILSLNGTGCIAAEPPPVPTAANPSPQDPQAQPAKPLYQKTVPWFDIGGFSAMGFRRVAWPSPKTPEELEAWMAEQEAVEQLATDRAWRTLLMRSCYVWLLFLAVAVALAFYHPKPAIVLGAVGLAMLAVSYFLSKWMGAIAAYVFLPLFLAALVGSIVWLALRARKHSREADQEKNVVEELVESFQRVKDRTWDHEERRTHNRMQSDYTKQRVQDTKLKRRLGRFAADRSE